MTELQSLALNTYRRLVDVLGQGQRFLDQVKPDDHWRLSSDDGLEALGKRLKELHEMIDSLTTMSPEDRSTLDVLIAKEIVKMKSDAINASGCQKKALNEFLPPADLRQLDISLSVAVSEVKLDSIFEYRQRFCLATSKAGTLSLKEQILLEDAVEKTYDLIRKSGLQAILISHQDALLRFSSAASSEVAENANEAPENQRLDVGQLKLSPHHQQRNWLAIAEGGVLVTGAVFTLALCVYDPANVDDFARKCGALVAILEGLRIIKDGLDPQPPR